MRRKTKTSLLLVAFTFIFLGWAFPEWRPHGFVIPYYEETAADLRTVSDKLQQHVASARTSSYGIFVEHNIAAIGGVYVLIALSLLLQPQDRNEGWNNLWRFFAVAALFVVLFVVGVWIAKACHNINEAHGGHWAFQRGLGSLLISIATGIIWPLLTIALGVIFWLTLWIGIPAYLLLLLLSLPSILYVILRLPVRLPILAYHYLHYLMVPHPAEEVYKNGMARGVPLPELARDVARAMYVHDLNIYNRPPPVWKSQNQKKRIAEAEKLLHAGRAFMQEFEKCVLQDAKLHDD